MTKAHSSCQFMRLAVANGLLGVAAVLSGCGSSETTPTPASTDAKPAETTPANATTAAGKSKIDTMSRRERQKMLKEKAAAAPGG